MAKELLEGYVGVKYAPVCRSEEDPEVCERLYRRFRAAGDRLAAHDMAPANGGNLSERVEGGFVVTTSGCNLGCIDPGELALVRRCSLDTEEVEYEGPVRPSSEAMLHWLLYRDLPGAGAVVHAHDEVATSGAAAHELPETAREEPYGTVALARLAAETFARGGEIIVLKNHGYVAIGSDLERALERVVAMHLALLARR